MAVAAARSTAVGQRVRVLQSLAQAGGVGADPSQLVHAVADRDRTQSTSQRGDSRQPVGENDGKGGVKGFDFHKKVKGRKRHLLVDTQGLVIVAQVTGANVQDHHQVYELIAEGKERCPRLQKVWVDEGYQGKDVAATIRDELEIELEIVPKPVGQKGFAVIPRRWVVERTFAWLGRYRRLSKDYEYHAETAQAMIYCAMSYVMLRRLGRQGAG